MTTKKFRLVKFMYDKELNNSNGKIYDSKDEAINDGQSWTNDSTIDREIRKQRWFNVVEC